MPSRPGHQSRRYDKNYIKNITKQKRRQKISRHMVSISDIWTDGWRHQMETFSALLSRCAGNSPITGEFPRKGQRRGALTYSLICAWTKGSINNWDVGDLRCYRFHYDVTVMGCMTGVMFILWNPIGSNWSWTTCLSFIRGLSEVSVVCSVEYQDMRSKDVT